MKCEPASKLSLVSGNYHEPAEPVVMVMASIDVKIRHVFADTPLTEESIGAAPPVVQFLDLTTDLNYWIKLLSCIIEANGGHIGLSHINLHWYY